MLWPAAIPADWGLQQVRSRTGQFRYGDAALQYLPVAVERV
jgi:hypothetical protein